LSRLFNIQYTVQKAADAITAALGIDTEIVDNELTIIAGTGQYRHRVGLKEEGGLIDSGYMYGRILSSGEEYTVRDAKADPNYDPSVALGKTMELAEICCPIVYEGHTLGVVGLIAFSEQQRKDLLANEKAYHLFLRRMGYLIASKASETEKSEQIQTILETIHEGIIAVDAKGEITLCNQMAEKLLRHPRREIVGQDISTLWPNFPFPGEMNGDVAREHEQIYVDSKYGTLHFLVKLRVLVGGETEGGIKSLEKTKNNGAVISFRDMAEVRQLVYDITENKQSSGFEDIIGVSQILLDLKEKAQRVAMSSSTVLITGESGTGKELFARAIHFSSPRSQGPFITVNCGAIPEALLESELFGYESGAFTGARKGGKAGKFEIANKGTIFLDEIGDMPLHLQVKLLHVLQRHEMERIGSNTTIPVDVRVVAATNRDLELMMQENEFREDLYFRLNVIPFFIPPLRERREDVELLLRHCLRRAAVNINKEIDDFDQPVKDLLMAYDWPGNVRELENTMEYVVNMAPGKVATEDCLPMRIKRTVSDLSKPRSLRYYLETKEKEIIVAHLDRHGRSLEGKRRAAKELGISQATLYRRIRELEID